MMIGMSEHDARRTLLATPVAEIIFTACDIETTGLNPQKDAIIEIGAVQYKDQKEIGTFQQLIYPGDGVENLGQEINGITPEMLDKQPSIATVLPDFVKFVGDSVLVGHNIQSFDLPFIRTGLITLGMTPLYNHVIDTLALSRRVFPKNARHSLGEMVRVLNIPHNNAHRALSDAIACGKLLHRIVDEISFLGDSPPLQDIS